MSGQRATDHTRRGASAPRRSRAGRGAAVVCGVLALAVCGAVAQASSDPGGGAKGIGAPKAAAAPTSESAEVDAVPPDDLGDDPDLDALAQSCFDGDLVACDHLYLRSPVDSAYETYGDTCAGRQGEGTGLYCGLSSAGPPSGEPTPPDGLGDDAALDALAQSCYAGDMAACDELYGSAESGSAYQAYGDTCAGRQPENTGNYCTALQNPVPGAGVTPTTAAEVPTSAAEATSAVDETTAPPDTVAGPETTSPSAPGEIPAPTVEPTGLGDDPALDALAQSCYDGELSACDDLYEGSDPGTAYRAYGDTCAGRQAEDTGTWCVDAFGGEAPSTEPPPSDAPTTTAPAATTSPPTTFPAATTPLPTLPPIPTTTSTIPVPVSPTTSLPFVPTTLPGETTSTVVGAIPPPTLEPTGLGDDPALDALAQACFDGQLDACDTLWSDSAEGSAYRNYGDTCAGRQPPNTGVWCADAFAGAPPSTGTIAVPPTAPGSSVPPIPPVGIPPATQQPTGLGDDPALDALASACFAGDMQACDDLFDQSPIGSAYMTYGDTCAGRQEPHTFNYCRVAFPG